MNNEIYPEQNIQDKFVIEKISDFFKVSPWFFIILITLVADIFWIFMTDLYRFVEGGLWWSVFGLYIYFILSTYKHDLVNLVKKFKNEGLIAENYQIELYSNWLRIPAYIFWYGYFIYFSVKVFDLNGYNLLNSLISFSFIYKIGLVVYIFSWVAIALPMIGDGFGILPVIWGLSEKIFEKKEKGKIKFRLFHEDKCAGFKPLGDFAFKISLLIGLPFIIGMPIRIYQLNKIGLLTFGGIFNDPFSMAFLGVGFASSVLFIKSSYYIYRKIEGYKNGRLKEISKKYENCYTNLHDLNKENPKEKVETINYISNRIYLLDIEVKKINEVRWAPWGENRIRQFYSIIFSPTILTLLLRSLLSN